MRSLMIIVLFLATATFAVRRRSAEEILKAVQEEMAAENGSSPTTYKKKSTIESRQMARRNVIVQKTHQALVHEGLNKREISDMMSTVLRLSGIEMDVCTETPLKCDFASKYRTIDGTCNNPHRIFWGSVGVSLRRDRRNAYDDGKSIPRSKGGTLKTFDCPPGGPLPNPRKVSSTFHTDVNVPAHIATHMLTQWGQFLDHDMSLTPETHVEHCCTATAFNKDCLPITIPSSDPFYASRGQTCLEFTRSEEFCASSDRPIREQFNAITAFIDSSNVYGSSPTVSSELRTKSNGLLAVTTTGTGKTLLPMKDGVFIAGDVRATEMPGLATMHTLFVREHNRIAKVLKSQYPSYTDEKLFQETRRIVNAEMQNIVYNEYLPVVLGLRTMEKYHLFAKPGSTYNPNADPSITNVFATVAYRFGHSMIQGNIKRIALNFGGPNTTYALKDNYFNMANYVYDEGKGMEEILNGLLIQEAQEMDRFCVNDVTEFLFRDPAKDFGSDLVARNIQRGRDHGIPRYGEWRRFCGLPRICSWDQKPPEFSNKDWSILRTLYKHPEDMDFFTAGSAEAPVPGGVTGPTFNCIKAKQFRDLKHGDRFFFTHRDQVGSFKKEQVDNLVRRRLGDIICDNTDIKKVRGNSFDLRSKMFDCKMRTPLKLSLF